MVWVVFVRESTLLNVHVTVSAEASFIVAVFEPTSTLLLPSVQEPEVNPNPLGRLAVTTYVPGWIVIGEDCPESFDVFTEKLNCGSGDENPNVASLTPETTAIVTSPGGIWFTEILNDAETEFPAESVPV